jgi:hypothetical protein
MAAIALGALGAGVGSFFGYASIGWSIGSALGNYFFAPDQPDIEGPRLTDRRVSGSAYGTMRPRLYGTYRMAGEIIWSDKIKERKHSEDYGGKGGGGGEYITYTYDVSFALALCAGECAGIRKIWMDSKLVWTAADDSSVGELIKSEKLARKIKFYPGSETQMPDPTLEAVNGVGNVPAYRGTAYLVFERLEITPFGNRIPQITVEVVKNGGYSVTDNVPNDAQTGLSFCSIGFSNGTLTHYNQLFSDEDAAGRLQATQRVYDLNDLTTTLETRSASALQNGAGTRRHVSVSPNYKVAIFQDSNVGGTSATIGTHYFDEITGMWLPAESGVAMTVEDLDNLINIVNSYGHLFKWESDYSFYFYKSNSGDLYKYQVVAVPGLEEITYQLEILWVEKVASDATDANFGPPFSICIDKLSRDVFVSLEELGVNKIKRYSSDGDLLETKIADTSPYEPLAQMGFSNGLLWQIHPESGVTLKIIEWDTDTIIEETLLSSGPSSFGDHSPIIEVAGNVAFMYLADAEIYTARLNFSGDPEPLSEVVSDISTYVGLEVGEIDVSDIAGDNVRGYLISQQTPARGALEQLSAAYMFDARESDGVLEFIKRGRTPEVSLADDDLGCYEGDDVQELADAVRVQEEELPKAITLIYANVGADYLPGAQYSLRQSVLNGTESTISLPIAFTDDEAKSIVDTLMFSAWEGRHRFTMRTWQKFHKLDPADVISARGETLRIINRAEGVNGIIEVEAVRELPQIYDGQIGSGSSGSIGGQAVTVNGPTRLMMLDTPPLRDIDYQAYGLYAAANGLLPDWSGYTLLRSPDFGDTYTSVQTSDAGSTLGQSLTALGDFADGNIFDHTNTVRVSVLGVLETKTELEVLNGANIAVLGDELIQFKTATLVSTGVYDLSGLLRGRIGTEWATAGHGVNERFALLASNSTRFAPVAYTDLNVIRRWGAVTFGDYLEEVTTSDVIYTGNNLKPICPVNINGGVTGLSTAWTIRWMRRSRYEWQWVDYYDVGADETSYDFEVRIYDDPENPVNPIRTIAVTGATVGVDGFFSTTYSLANQTADLGGFQLKIAVSIRQVGAFRNSEWSPIEVLNSGYSSGISSAVLLHFNGANGSTTFTDVAGNAWNAGGDAQISTTGQKFGSGCLLLDGGGDYVTSASAITALKNLTSSDFTIAMWLSRSGAGTGNRYILDARNGSDFDFLLRWTSGGVLEFWTRANGGGSALMTYTFAFTTNTQYYVTVERSGNNWTLGVDGVAVDTETNSGTFSNTNAPFVRIGATHPGAIEYYQGRVDDFQIVKQALHTYPFTPPTFSPPS